MALTALSGTRLIGNHEMSNLTQNYSLYTEYIRNTTQYAVDFNPGFGLYRFIMLNTNHEYGLNSFFAALWRHETG